MDSQGVSMRFRFRPAACVCALPAVLLLMALAAGCGPAESGGASRGNPEDEVTEVVEDVYKALGECDGDALEEAAAGDFAEELSAAADSEAGLEGFCHPYGSLEFEVADVEVDDDEAEAQVEFVFDTYSYHQILELELDDDEWKVTSLGVPELQPDPETAGRTEEEKVRYVVDQVLTALKNSDPEALSRFATDEMRRDFLPGYFALLRSTGEWDVRLAEMRRRWSEVSWTIARSGFEDDGRKAWVTVDLNLGGRIENWLFDLVLEDGRWLCRRLGKAGG